MLLHDMMSRDLKLMSANVLTLILYS